MRVASLVGEEIFCNPTHHVRPKLPESHLDGQDPSLDSAVAAAPGCGRSVAGSGRDPRRHHLDTSRRLRRDQRHDQGSSRTASRGPCAATSAPPTGGRSQTTKCPGRNRSRFMCAKGMSFSSTAARRTAPGRTCPVRSAGAWTCGGTTRENRTAGRCPACWCAARRIRPSTIRRPRPAATRPGSRNGGKPGRTRGRAECSAGPMPDSCCPKMGMVPQKATKPPQTGMH